MTGTGTTMLDDLYTIGEIGKIELWLRASHPPS